MGSNKLPPQAPPPPRWNFILDRYINRFVPSSPVGRLPRVFGWFLGHRGPDDLSGGPLGNVVIASWAFLGVVVSLSLIHAVARQVPAFKGQQGSLILGSFGATAVLEFYAIDSPLAQPRNVIMGQLIASIVGMSISKTLANDPNPEAQDVAWLAGIASCASTVVLMGLTGTVHPPAGATALIAVTDPHVSQLGWMLVPLVLLSCLLMLIVALFINNFQRRFPLYWWSPGEVGAFWRRPPRRRSGVRPEDAEAAKSPPGVHVDDDIELLSSSASSPASSPPAWGQPAPQVHRPPAAVIITRGGNIRTYRNARDFSAEEMRYLEGLYIGNAL